ncbi:MAG: hydrogenase 4 subunit F [Ruminiclostridium sp.]|nr:hydrogenase 4 subunit F [Ruminiclostridium sp.]
MLFLLLIVPLTTSLLFWTVRESVRTINIINATGSAILFAVSLLNLKVVLEQGKITSDFFGGIFYIDSLNGLILFATTLVSLLISIYSIGYMNEEYKRSLVNIARLRLYYCLLHLFIFTMILTTITQNIGVMWISIEATTLASAFLVGFYNNRKSIEAAWKYIIICSVGIAFALLGVILLYYSSVISLGQTVQGLNWQFLNDNAGSLHSSILKIAFLFILIGFGTKVGLAPMHTWLPDAHSQAPSPVSALLSGVLLNTAMYGIIRIMTIVNKNMGNSQFTGSLMIILGLVSIGAAAVFILVQQDFKRTLAYSSIEHMGIIALGIGISSALSIFAALFHIINHSLTKSMLFAASGNVYLKYDTKKISKIQGILKVMPVTGTVFLLGIFAITGMPPFSIFTSELGITISAFKEGKYLAVGFLLAFLVLIFAGFSSQMLRMFFGKPHKDHGIGEMNRITPVVLLILLAIITVTGIYLPSFLEKLIKSAGDIILLVH